MRLPDAELIIVLGEIVVAAEDCDALLSIVRDDVKRVRTKAGCLGYYFACDVLDGTVIRLFEVWADEKSLRRHLSSDDFMRSLTRANALHVLSRQGMIFRSRKADTDLTTLEAPKGLTP